MKLLLMVGGMASGLLASGCAQGPASILKQVQQVNSVGQAKNTLSLSEPIEFYFYINADNDLMGTDENGKTVSQGRVVYEALKQQALASPDQSAFHFYFDPNTKLDGVSSESEALSLVNGAVMERMSFEETDSSDESHLVNLLSRRSFSGEVTRVLVIWGHGSGWRSVQDYDFSEEESSFGIEQMAHAIARSGTQLTSVIFDACEMGSVEVLSDLKGLSRFVIASQFKLPPQGISYESLARTLSEQAHAREKTTIQSLYEVFQSDTRKIQDQKFQFAPLVLYDLDELEGVVHELNALFREASLELNAGEWKQLRTRAKPLSFRLYPRDQITADLRALVSIWEKLSGRSAVALIEAFQKLSYRGYGSLNLFLPDDPTFSRKEGLKAEVDRRGSHYGRTFVNWAEYLGEGAEK